MPKFAKRHYEAIAAALRESLRKEESLSDDAADGVNEAIQNLESLFARDNPKFSRERFERACYNI